MKICLVGHFQDNLDEGVRNVGKCIVKELINRKIDVKKVDISSFFCWKEIRDFRPDVIHFVISPTLAGIIYAIFSSIYFKQTQIVISAIHPSFPKWKLLNLSKIDMILVQSHESEQIFKSLCCQTRFIPNGVDIGKFKCVDVKTKQNLRDKYGFSYDKFIILHMATLNKERNLDCLIDIQGKDNNQVLIVGRKNQKVDNHVVNKLQSAGCKIWVEHFPNIEEIYNLSDCYIFPTVNKKSCVETPLSVLEAMACNLPVITTKFGTLPILFDHKDGLFFIDKEKDIYKYIETIKNRNIEIRTIEQVLIYSWENICKKFETIYKELLLTIARR